MAMICLGTNMAANSSLTLVHFILNRCRLHSLRCRKFRAAVTPDVDRHSRAAWRVAHLYAVTDGSQLSLRRWCSRSELPVLFFPLVYSIDAFVAVSHRVFRGREYTAILSGAGDVFVRWQEISAASKLSTVSVCDGSASMPPKTRLPGSPCFSHEPPSFERRSGGSHRRTVRFLTCL